MNLIEKIIYKQITFSESFRVERIFIIFFQLKINFFLIFLMEICFITV